MPQSLASAKIQTAEKLLNSAEKIRNLSCLVGFDGFVDEVIRIVDKRHSTDNYTPIPTITAFLERIAKTAGKSTNIEMAVQQIKLGGNGPIFANAMATFGLQTTCIGSLGYPELHPVFYDFAKKADAISIAEPAFTLALEFDDGKLMLNRTETLQEVTYENIIEILSKDGFKQLWQQSDLISINNWTMLLPMTDLWQKILQHHCQNSDLSRQSTIYFDLADPEKRTQKDMQECLATMTGFTPYFKAILGCNEKESVEISRILEIKTGNGSKEDLQTRAQAIRERLQIDCLVIHPVKFAVAATEEKTALADGPFTPNPKISTGAGDHFNAGFCLASILNFDLGSALLAGVATAGYYVRHAAPPTVSDLVAFLKSWN
jgi:sugar/nucleoside kinase (ribokinase family)